MSKFFSNPVVRSTLITFITALALIVTASDFAWTKAALVAAVVSAARTVLSALIPGGSFGVGSTDPGTGA